MKEIDVDVVVVGAGPAGGFAAQVMAEKGVDVLVIEKKQEIGTPKRCAEGVNIIGLNDVGMEPEPHWAINEIVGAHLYAPSGKMVLMQTSTSRGFVLERKIFEKDIAKKAIKAGARYMVKTRATRVLMEGDRVVGVMADFMGEKIKVNAKITVAADGVDSLIARKAGLDSLNRVSDYHSGFQYEMAGVETPDEYLSLFFGNKIAPKGYIWIFPKGDTVANVGVGILGSASKEGARAKDLLDAFIAENPKFFGNASPIEVNAGGIPVNNNIDCFVKDGFMVVGDAAQQVNPIHGGGIAIALRAAKIVGEVASAAIEEGDSSKQRLMEYDERWRAGDGKRIDRLLRLRLFLEKLEDKDFERFANALSGDDVMDMVAGDFKAMVRVAAKMPRLLPLARKLL